LGQKQDWAPDYCARSCLCDPVHCNAHGGAFSGFNSATTLLHGGRPFQATGYVFASAIADQVAAGDQQAILSALRSIRRVPDVRQVIAIDSAGHEIASLGTASMLQSDIVGEKTGWFSF
jgi:hypothetical protein